MDERRPVEVEPSLYEGMAASIYDPNKPRGHQTICECREYADALRIAAALNSRERERVLREALEPFATVPPASPDYPYTLCQQVRTGPYHIENTAFDRARRALQATSEG